MNTIEKEVIDLQKAMNIVKQLKAEAAESASNNPIVQALGHPQAYIDGYMEMRFAIAIQKAGFTFNDVTANPL